MTQNFARFRTIDDRVFNVLKFLQSGWGFKFEVV